MHVYESVRWLAYLCCISTPHITILNQSALLLMHTLPYTEQDAKQLAAWGADYWKLDGCWLEQTNEVMSAVYTKWSQALNATGRPIVFSCRCVRECVRGCIAALCV